MTVQHSAIYAGVVGHRRHDAVAHRFRMPLYFVYLDLDEVDAAFAGRWWWSARRPAPLWFRRGDFFGPADRPLADAVRDAVAARIGERPDGPVRVLTNLRAFGFSFNPVSVYYCFDRGERLVAALAEITNTPWRQRHHYVVAADPRRRALRARFGKEFHVSPFQPMEQDYEWTLSPPGEALGVHMRNVVAGRTVFDATLALRRRPWTTANLLLAALRFPVMSVAVIVRIHFEALRLWCKRAPFHVHPEKRRSHG